MRRWIALLFMTLFGLVILPGPANASHSPGQGNGPPQDFVVGGGHHSSPDTQFTFSAHSGPLGEDAKGHLNFKLEGEPRVRADVTCLIVVGNQAFVTAQMRQPGGGLVVLHAVDNGEPSDATPDLLRFSFASFIRPAPGSPGCFLPVLPPAPVTQGNIVVHDGTP